MRLPFITENTVDLASDINDTLLVIDGLITSRVDDMATHPSGSQSHNDRIAITAPAIGEFAGKAGQLAIWEETGAFWRFYEPVMCVYNNAMWISTGTDWVAA